VIAAAFSRASDGRSPAPTDRSKRSRTRYLVVSLFGALLVYSAIGLGVVASSENATRDSGSIAGIGVLGLVGVGLSFFAFQRRNEARAAFYERQEQAAKKGVDNALEELGGETDLRGLLRLNRSQMEAYEALTRRQADSAYRLSHVALAVGLVVVLAGAAGAMFASQGATRALRLGSQS
jgi:hypothetical protein